MLLISSNFLIVLFANVDLGNRRRLSVKLALAGSKWTKNKSKPKTPNLTAQVESEELSLLQIVGAQEGGSSSSLHQGPIPATCGPPGSVLALVPVPISETMSAPTTDVASSRDTMLSPMCPSGENGLFLKGPHPFRTGWASSSHCPDLSQVHTSNLSGGGQGHTPAETLGDSCTPGSLGSGSRRPGCHQLPWGGETPPAPPQNAKS